MPLPSNQPVILIGASVRGAAVSAMACGFEPWCIDLFADRDLQAIARTYRCEANKYPHDFLRIIDTLPLHKTVPVIYTGGLENHVDMLQAIALQRPLLGCQPDAVEKVRLPGVFADLPAGRGLGVCRVLQGRPWGSLLFKLPYKNYLLKPIRGCGGQNIAHWRPGQKVLDGYYLQQYVKGIAYSASYQADGWSARLLGITEQIIGDRQFGVCGFRYCGSLGPITLSHEHRQMLSAIGVSLTQQHDLHGPWGMDFILDKRNRIWPIEINPRYTASMEILTQDSPMALFSPAQLPLPQTKRNRPLTARCLGKAIVFAKQTMTTPDLYTHFRHDQIADVPGIGQSISAGQPICTVFTQQVSRDAALADLHQQAHRLYTFCSHG